MEQSEQTRDRIKNHELEIRLGAKHPDGDCVQCLLKGGRSQSVGDCSLDFYLLQQHADMLDRV